MENRKQLLTSGIFIFIGISAILISIILLGGNSKFFNKTSYLFVKFEQVQGLNPGAVVSLAGLPVGNVEDFEFDGKLVTVKMGIKASSFQRLTQGTEAEIRTQGALGDKFVYLTAGAPDGAPLADNAEIPAKITTDLLDILSDKGKETEKLFEIIAETHVLLKSINDNGRVRKILGNLEDASSSFQRVAHQSESSIGKFDRILTRVEKGEGTLGALITDSSIHDQIKSMLGGSQRKSHVKSMLRKSVELNEVEDPKK